MDRPVPDRAAQPEQPPLELTQRVRDVAIQALGETDARLHQSDELVAAITGSALKAIVAARAGLFTAGHTPDNDEMLPIPWLPFEVQQHAAFASAKIGLTGKDRDLPAAEQLLAVTAAYCMAAIDRLRLARARGEG
jgi:hypothetical protein